MKKWSIRTKIMLWSAAIVAVALTLFGAGTAYNLRKEIIENVDHEIKSEARDFFDRIKTRSVDWNNEIEVESLFNESTRMRFIEITKKEGLLLYRSRNLHDQSLITIDSNRDIENIQIRQKTIRFGVFEKHGILLALGQNLHEPIETVSDLMSAYVLALPLVLIAIVVGVWFSSGRALAPIETIISNAERITANALDQRLPLVGTNDEVGRLTIVLNEMFDRLAKSFQQSERFTSDASHELKTPLAIMRGEVETALRSNLSDFEQEKALVSVLEQITRLTQIIESLLLLSRADAGKLMLDLQKVNISALVDETVEDMSIVAKSRNVTISADVQRDVVLLADAHRLRQILLNLLDNSVKYNNQNGAVCLSLGRHNDLLTIAIRNTGPGILPEQAQQLFGRFYRGDASHSSEVRGNGLGLSICQEIARLHEGKLELSRFDSEWTEFCLTLPCPKLTEL